MTAKKAKPITIAQHSVGKQSARGVLPWKPGDEPAEETVARSRGRGKDLPIRKIHPIFKMKLFFRKLLTAMKKRIFNSHK